MANRTRRAFLCAGVASLIGLPANILAKESRRKKKRNDKEPKPRPATITAGGALVTHSFYLVEGRYVVTAKITPWSSTGGLFFVRLHGPGGFEDSLFIENPEAALTYEYQTVTQLPKSGRYFLEVEEADGPWRIRFQPR